MTERLPGWAILAATAAVAAAAFVASADITHWVIGLHQTEVVIRRQCAQTYDLTRDDRRPDGHAAGQAQAGTRPELQERRSSGSAHVTTEPTPTPDPHRTADISALQPGDPHVSLPTLALQSADVTGVAPEKSLGPYSP
jgi:hypothetical protein